VQNVKFPLSEVILLQYKESMRKFKMEFLEWIDISITVGGMRRILRFKLDIEWLRSIIQKKHCLESAVYLFGNEA